MSLCVFSLFFLNSLLSCYFDFKLVSTLKHVRMFKLFTLLTFQEEEYEDSKGNVVNKKTYEDLKRQGLL